MARKGEQINYKSVHVMFAVTLFVVLINGVNGDNNNNNNSQVQCYFIFGDSLADSGNNNVLPTLAKANYEPYGYDFPGAVPTGRFTNGLNSVDFIGKYLGFVELIPASKTARGNSILKGVNYASGGAGIRDETGQQLGFLLTMNRQLASHQLTVLQINNIFGSIKAGRDYLKKCIYHVGMGNNDYLNNYFLPYYPTSLLYTPQQYAQALINQYRFQITRLYEMGARKVALAGAGLIGCTPYAISSFGTNGSACVDRLNNAAQLFNDKLFDLVNELNSNYSDAKFIFINVSGIAAGYPTSAGLTVLNVACCAVDNSSGLCDRFSNVAPCQNRSNHAFWDKYHTTEVINKFVADRSYCSPLPSETFPINIKDLAQLNL